MSRGMMDPVFGPIIPDFPHDFEWAQPDSNR